MKVSTALEQNIDDRLLEFARSTDRFEGYAEPHAEKIASLCDAVAERLGLGSLDRLFLKQAALIHDIGEAVMNRDCMSTNRTLSAEERTDMERHAVIGEQEATKLGLNRAVQLFVRWHHEAWDGSGYPDSLEREEIPLPARILRVVDAYSAYANSRPFRAAYPVSDVRKLLIERSGLEFDPMIVRVFFSVIPPETF